MKRVLVVGFDGMEPSIVDSLLAAGELPNLAKVARQGAYARIGTTYPAQTPVAWSTFATGVNPGGHGIFDFIRRDPKTYLPDLALTRYEQRNPYVPPQAVNLRRGTPLWEVLSAAGIPSVVLRHPCTFPPDAVRGRMLSGVGVPDLRGGLGTSTFYTSRERLMAKDSERVVTVQTDASGRIKMYVLGPRHPRQGLDCHSEVTLHLEPEQRRVLLRSDGDPHTLEIREGEWSGWLRLKFKTGMLQSVQGIVRFYLSSIAPHFELHASPVNFAPGSPLFPISSPPEFAGELARRTGLFYTAGMAEDHTGLNNGRFSEHAFLEQCRLVLGERERIMEHELARFEEGFFFCLFDTPDRLQHMLWRFREPAHPANNGAGADPELARAIEEHYRECDRIVGRVLEHAGEETLLMVLSDHGMNTFQRGVHLNTWLWENGLLALQNGSRPGGDEGEFFRNVDWSRTRAYALGLGGIYLNRRGREEKGIVSEEEAAGLAARIASSLSKLGDPGRGVPAIRSIATREQIYSGPFAAEAPDLLVNFSRGYRVSWSTALGGMPPGLIEDNTKRWAGDHIIDPCLVPGVLFMNQAFQTAGPTLADMAPTILAALGVEKAPAMEGRSLLI